MPPKPAPKLTKKQLAQLKKEEQKKKEEETRIKMEEDQAREKQEQRLAEIERKKRAEEERIRIVEERQQYHESINKKISQEQITYKAMQQQKYWEARITPYFKDYRIEGSNLTTFIHIFEEATVQPIEKILKLCQEAEVYVIKLYEKLLDSRVDCNYKMEEQCRFNIQKIHQIEMKNMKEIMIVMANCAQDMEEKNNQFLKNKNQPNKKIDGQKLFEYQYYLSQSFKIGMFLNSTTTKNINKFRPIEIKQFGLNTEIPSKWISANTIVKFQWVDFNPYPMFGNESFITIGGVYNIEFYELLLGSKKINNIVLKKYFKGTEILQRFKLPTSVIKDSFQIMYQIPKYVFLTPFEQKQLKIAQYDCANSKWSLLNDCVVQFTPKDKKIVCRVARPEPIAYVQYRCQDFPYVSWHLRTVLPGTVHLDIELKRYMKKQEQQLNEKKHLMVKFEIKQDEVRLLMHENYPEFTDLSQNSHSPENLLHLMSKRGIHLLPQDQDYQQIDTIKAKDKESEQNAIHDIAYAVESFFVSSEPNNTEHICVKIRENLDYESIFLQDQEKDWKKIRWGNTDRCWVDGRGIYQRHLNLQVLMEKHDFCVKQCVDRMVFNKQYLLRKTIIKMLSLTKILSFTTSQPENSVLKQILKRQLVVK